MNNLQLHLALILILITALIIVYSTKNDKVTYDALLSSQKKLYHSEYLLKNEAEGQIRLAEHETDKSIYLKPIVDKAKKIHTEQKDLYQLLHLLKREIGEPILLEKENSYAKKRQSFFKTKNEKESEKVFYKKGKTLVLQYNNFRTMVEETFKDTINLPLWDSLYKEELQTLNQEIWDETVFFLGFLKDEKSLTDYTQNMDIVHKMFFLQACSQELNLVEYRIAKNICEYVERCNNPYSKQTKHTIMSWSNENEGANQPPQIMFYPLEYIDNESLVMRVNGEKIPVKNGVGTFTSNLPKELFIDISVENPIRQNRVNFTKRFRFNNH